MCIVILNIFRRFFHRCIGKEYMYCANWWEPLFTRAESTWDNKGNNFPISKCRPLTEDVSTIFTSPFPAQQIWSQRVCFDNFRCEQFDSRLVDLWPWHQEGHTRHVYLSPVLVTCHQEDFQVDYRSETSISSCTGLALGQYYRFC